MLGIQRYRTSLRASDSGVRQIVDASPVLACSLTAQLEVEFVSQSLLDYFGKTLDELKNWTSIGVVHPNDLEAVIAQIRHSAETGESFDFENRCRRYDGVFRWLQARGLPLRNAQGQIERWYVLLIDIEDKRRAEDALRKTERSLNLIINTIPEMAWSTEPDGSVDFSTSDGSITQDSLPTKRLVGIRQLRFTLTTLEASRSTGRPS